MSSLSPARQKESAMALDKLWICEQKPCCGSRGTLLRHLHCSSMYEPDALVNTALFPVLRSQCSYPELRFKLNKSKSRRRRGNTYKNLLLTLLVEVSVLLAFKLVPADFIVSALKTLKSAGARNQFFPSAILHQSSKAREALERGKEHKTWSVRATHLLF